MTRRRRRSKGRGYRLLYLPLQGFSQSCCRLWTGWLFRRRREWSGWGRAGLGGESAVPGSRIHNPVTRVGGRSRSYCAAFVSSEFERVWCGTKKRSDVRSYRLAWWGCCCPPALRRAGGALGTWRAWGGTTSSQGCGTSAPASQTQNQPTTTTIQ